MDSYEGRRTASPSREVGDRRARRAVLILGRRETREYEIQLLKQCDGCTLLPPVCWYGPVTGVDSGAWTGLC